MNNLKLLVFILAKLEDVIVLYSIIQHFHISSHIKSRLFVFAFFSFQIHIPI
jgi:hypothetical protein